MRTALNFKTTYTLQGISFRFENLKERFLNLETSEGVCDTVLIALSSFFWTCILRKELSWSSIASRKSKISHVAGYLSCLLAFSLSPAAIALFLGFPWWGKKEKYVALKFLWPWSRALPFTVHIKLVRIKHRTHSH